MIGEIGHDYIGSNTNNRRKMSTREETGTFSDLFKEAKVAAFDEVEQEDIKVHSQTPTEEELWAFIRERK